VAIFLKNAIIIASDPNVVLFVEDAAVDRSRNSIVITHGLNHFSGGIENHDGGRVMVCFGFLFCDVTSVYHRDVIV
jgi:hypothetical protein